MAFTRRTHVVRIKNESAGPADPSDDAGQYIDVEVLDAISFRYENGKEMVLNMPKQNVRAFIKDPTSGGHAKRPNIATRLSHMKRIVNGDNKLDVEVIEVMAFRDQNGEEWILDMHDTNGDPSVFNKTDGTGDRSSTRRTHNEKITSPFGTKNPDTGSYLTVERCDQMAFRHINGKEMIVLTPSNDDPNSSDPRASTYIWSPRGYDPADESIVPPPNTDDNVYVAFVGNANCLTGDKKISQGPLWWIRKVSSGQTYVLVTIRAQNNATSTTPPANPSVDFDLGAPGSQGWKLLDSKEVFETTIFPPDPSDSTVYFVWPDGGPSVFPTLDTYQNSVFVNPPFNIQYGGQFAILLDLGTGARPPDSEGISDDDNLSNSSGFFSSSADANRYASAINERTSGGPSGTITASYFTADGGSDTYFSGAFKDNSFGVGTLTIHNDGSPFSIVTLNGKYLFKIPTAESHALVTPRVNTDNPGGTSNIYVQGFSDQATALATVDDADASTPDPDQPPQFGRQGMNAHADNRAFTVTTESTANPDISLDNPKAHQVKITITGGTNSSGGVG